jgi:hypothetical protein
MREGLDIPEIGMEFGEFKHNLGRRVYYNGKRQITRFWSLAPQIAGWWCWESYLISVSHLPHL